MGGRRILTDPQVDEMASLREQGWTLRAIADRFTAAGTKVSVGSIGWQCLRVGADLPAEKRRPIDRRSGPIVRGTHVIRPFTPDEDQKLLALEESGMAIAAIGREIGRRQNSVRGRLMVLARAEARLEEAA